MKIYGYLILFMILPAKFLFAETYQLKINTDPRNHRQISPYIYGFGTYFHENREQEGIWQLKPTAYRWGGNTSTRFNYLTNSWNTGADWFFMNIKAKEPNVVDAFMKQNLRYQAASWITLPIMGWVAKDGQSVSFPRSRFPKQLGFDGNAGNGIDMNGKAMPTDPNLTSIKVGPDFLVGWVKKLKTQFGSNPHFYILDNEPMLWHSTHRDVRFEKPLKYQEYLDIYINAAKAVRNTDPQAVIVGPALWGWFAWQRSAYDVEGPWNGWKQMQERKKYHDKPFLEWFLEQVVVEEKKFGKSLIDVVDVHYYPESDRWPKGEAYEPKVRKQLMEAPRSLWDPNYKDNSWIDEKIQFIPRLKKLAAKIKPGLKVAIGEYNFRSEYDISGAVTQAEILGIFAMTGVDAAFYWDFPRKDGTHRYAFEMYRNYDEKGASFGTHWLDNNIGIQQDISVYSSYHPSRKILTIVTINKHQSQSQDIQLPLSGPAKKHVAKQFLYASPKNPKIVEKKVLTLQSNKNELKWSLPPLSMSLVEVKI